MLARAQKNEQPPLKSGFFADKNPLVLPLISVLKNSFPGLQARVLVSLALWLLDCGGGLRMSARYYGQRNGIPKSTAARITLLALRLGLGAEASNSTDMNPRHHLKPLGIKLFNAARRAQSGTPAPTHRQRVENRLQAPASNDSGHARKLLTSWPKWDTVNKPKAYKTNNNTATRAKRAARGVVRWDVIERDGRRAGATAQQLEDVKARTLLAMAQRRMSDATAYARGILRNVLAACKGSVAPEHDSNVAAVAAQEIPVRERILAALARMGGYDLARAFGKVEAERVRGVRLAPVFRDVQAFADCRLVA